MSESLNIAVVGACPYPVPQGSQVYLRETALALREAGHRPELVVYGHGRGEDASGLPLHRAARVPGARRTSAGPSLAKPIQDALLLEALRRVARERRIDVVDAHNFEALAVALAARVRPIVFHAHNAFADELPHFLPHRGAAAALGRWVDTSLPCRADLVITPHESLRTYFISAGCSAERVHTVPPSIELGDPARTTNSGGLPALLYSGNLDRYQNLGVLGPVFRRVHESIAAAELVIATAETNSSRLLDAANLGRVLCAETLPEALDTLPEGAIFVCPRVSWSGFPIKLLNAMAAGLPIVAFEGAAHPLTHEADALVVRDGDAEAFVAAIVRLLKDAELRERLGVAARRTAESKHSRAAAAARLDGLFRRLRVASR